VPGGLAGRPGERAARQLILHNMLPQRKSAVSSRACLKNLSKFGRWQLYLVRNRQEFAHVLLVSRVDIVSVQIRLGPLFFFPNLNETPNYLIRDNLCKNRFEVWPIVLLKWGSCTLAAKRRWLVLKGCQKRATAASTTRPNWLFAGAERPCLM